MAASQPTRFNVLIVDPESESRGKLKQAALSLGKFHKVHVVSTLSEGHSKAESGESIDVVFISYRFEREESQAFIKACKSTKQGEGWAFILVLKAGEQKNEVIADAVMNGANGFLFEPYSADHLQEIAELTARVKMENADKRKMAALKMLLQEVTDHLDAVSALKAAGRDPKIAQKKFHDACKKLGDMRAKDAALYYSVLEDVFTHAPLRGGDSYSGVSKRVRARLAKKHMKQLEERYA